MPDFMGAGLLVRDSLDGVAPESELDVAVERYRPEGLTAHWRQDLPRLGTGTRPRLSVAGLG